MPRLMDWCVHEAPHGSKWSTAYLVGAVFGHPVGTVRHHLLTAQVLDIALDASWASTMSGYYRLPSPLCGDEAATYVERARSGIADFCCCRSSDVKLIPIQDLLQFAEFASEKAS